MNYYKVSRLEYDLEGQFILYLRNTFTFSEIVYIQFRFNDSSIFQGHSPFSSIYYIIDNPTGYDLKTSLVTQNMHFTAQHKSDQICCRICVHNFHYKYDFNILSGHICICPVRICFIVIAAYISYRINYKLGRLNLCIAVALFFNLRHVRRNQGRVPFPTVTFGGSDEIRPSSHLFLHSSRHN